MKLDNNDVSIDTVNTPYPSHDVPIMLLHIIMNSYWISFSCIVRLLTHVLGLT